MSDDPMACLVQALRAHLALTGAHYVAVEDPDGCHARVRFIGVYESEEVVWEATIGTLKWWRERAAMNDPAASSPEAHRRRFIDIGPVVATGRILRIGLDIAAIDHPAVLKSIIMVREYRRLRGGYHGFG